ncbi:MAG: hypothetical protein ACE5D1_01810 [Fidelibacterota bacterium]
MGKNTVVWLATIVITLSSVYYQRITNPNLPLYRDISINGKTIDVQFPQSHDTGTAAPIMIPVGDESVSGELQYRRVRSHDEWTRISMENRNGNLTGYLPPQPAAGKIMYLVFLIHEDGSRQSLTEAPVVLRYKGYIPLYLLLPHILLMFASMLISTRTGLEAVVQGPRTRVFAWWTLGLLSAGGLILGPIVQKFAFDAYWTGLPFGHDLTDNKTLIAVLGWVLALWKNRIPDEKNRKWYWIAAIIHLAVYMIPHSALGSELDYTGLPS